MIIFDRIFQRRSNGQLSNNGVKSLGSIFSCGNDKIAHEYKYNRISSLRGTVLITIENSENIYLGRMVTTAPLDGVHKAIPSGISKRVSSVMSATSSTLS